MRLRKTLVAVPVCLMSCAGVALAASSPTIVTGSATAIGDRSAVLNGSVDPNGAKATYEFEYGPTSAFGSVTKSASAGSGTKTVGVKTTISGLVPGTVYSYRLDASNGSGTALGATRTFKTKGNPPPGATTGAAAAVGRNSATVTGIIYPQNQATSWYFQYGPSTAYGVATAGGTVPAGTAPVTVSQVLSALQSGTTFHYRLVALHGSVAFNVGADASFETLPFPRPVPRVSASTAPRTDRSAPFDFITSGHVHGPSSTPNALECVGSVRITYRLGRKTVHTTVAPVQPDCSFAGSAGFRRLPGHGSSRRTVRLTVSTRFLGNGYLAPAQARRQTVVLK
jgi:hypothetical protein